MKKKDRNTEGELLPVYLHSSIQEKLLVMATNRQISEFFIFHLSAPNPFPFQYKFLSAYHELLDHVMDVRPIDHSDLFRSK